MWYLIRMFEESLAFNGNEYVIDQCHGIKFQTTRRMEHKCIKQTQATYVMHFINQRFFHGNMHAFCWMRMLQNYPTVQPNQNCNWNSFAGVAIRCVSAHKILLNLQWHFTNSSKLNWWINQFPSEPVSAVSIRQFQFNFNKPFICYKLNNLQSSPRTQYRTTLHHESFGHTKSKGLHRCC